MLIIESKSNHESNHLLAKETFKSLVQSEIDNNRKFSMALLDLDFFKNFNDTHGMEMGDLYIAKAFEVIQKNLRSQDQIIRYGGEEFALFLPDTPPESAYLLLEDIRRTLGERKYIFQLHDRKLKSAIPLSGGIAGFTRDGKSYSEVLRAADEALYRAKVDGRQRLTLAVSEKMKTKTSYYTLAQLERLAQLSKTSEKSESVLLREALDALLKKYNA